MRDAGTVYDVAFSPDGEKVITGSSDNTARLWDARTGAALGESMRHKHIVEAVAFSPDGQKVITGSSDNTARLWDIQPLVSPEEDPSQQHWLEIVTGTAFSPELTVPPRPLSMEEWTDRWRLLERDAQPFVEALRQESIRRSVEGHRDAARNAEDAGHWFAAEFHLRHLIRAEPENQELKSRYERVGRELERSKSAANSARNSAPAVDPVASKSKIGKEDTAYLSFGKVVETPTREKLDWKNPHHATAYAVWMCRQGKMKDLIKEMGHVQEDAELGKAFLAYITEFGSDLERYTSKEVYLKFHGCVLDKDTSIWYYWLTDKAGKNLEHSPWVSTHRSLRTQQSALTGIFLYDPDIRDPPGPMPKGLITTLDIEQ